MRRHLIRSRARLPLLATAIAIALTAAPGLAEAKILGAAAPAEASCPDDCLVEARVSGFQSSIGRIKQPFRVPANGRIVAWSVKLGRPAKEQSKFFTERFGPPQARISILKPMRIRRGKRIKLRYKLLRQGPAQNLAPFFGETTTFGLPQPLKARRGNVVALTIPSWAPAFATGQRARWRASRAPSAESGPCSLRSGFANLDAGAPQQDKGSLDRYACSYRGARLLYSARFLPDGSSRS